MYFNNSCPTQVWQQMFSTPRARHSSFGVDRVGEEEEEAEFPHCFNFIRSVLWTVVVYLNKRLAERNSVTYSDLRSVSFFFFFKFWRVLVKIILCRYTNIEQSRPDTDGGCSSFVVSLFGQVLQTVGVKHLG